MLSRLYCFRIKRWGLFAAILLPDRSGYDQSTYLDIVRSTNRLYVLTNEQYVINFVDIITHRIADKFYIAIDKEPSFMAVSHDNRFAYCILDPTGDNFFKTGLETGAPAE